MGTPTPLLSALRAGTSALHAELDARPLATRVLDGSLSPKGYRALLSWQFAAHHAADPGLAAYAWPANSGYAYTSRLPALIAEGVDVHTPVADLPAPTNLAEATGRAYVLAGSALGGNTILGHLRANPQLTEFAPFPFYAYLRTHGLAEWRAFTAFAKTRPWSAEDIEVAVEAAREVFNVFIRG